MWRNGLSKNFPKFSPQLRQNLGADPNLKKCHVGNLNPYKFWKFREKMSTHFRENKLQNFLQNVTFLKLGEFPTMENFIIDDDWCSPYVDQISFESVDPLTFEGDLKFSVPSAVMVTKNSKWRKKILGQISKICIYKSCILPPSTDVPNFVKIRRCLMIFRLIFSKSHASL